MTAAYLARTECSGDYPKSVTRDIAKMHFKSFDALLTLYPGSVKSRFKNSLFVLT